MVASVHKTYPFTLEQNRALEGLWENENINMKLRYSSYRFKNLFSISTNRSPLKSDVRFASLIFKKLELFALGHESADYFQHLGLTFLTIQQSIQVKYNLFVEERESGYNIVYDKNMDILAYAEEARTNSKSNHVAASCKCGNVSVKFLKSNHLKIAHNEKELYFAEQVTNQKLNYKLKYIGHIHKKCDELNQNLTCED